ncbi:META domain-containing protein [Arthrobacter sp. HLT1-20]
MRSRLVLLAASLLLLSACGATPGPGSTASEATAASAGAPEQCTPATGGIPGVAKDFECLDLISVSGSDSTGELAWLGKDPFTLVTLPRDGGVFFSSKTPCNTLMSQVEVTDTQFVVDSNLAMTMMACQSPQSDYENWVIKFFSTPLDYAFNAGSLTLSNSVGTVTFKPVGA